MYENFLFSFIIFSSPLFYNLRHIHLFLERSRGLFTQGIDTDEYNFYVLWRGLRKGLELGNFTPAGNAVRGAEAEDDNLFFGVFPLVSEDAAIVAQTDPFAVDAGKHENGRGRAVFDDGHNLLSARQAMQHAEQRAKSH